MFCRVSEQVFDIIRLLEEEQKKPKDYGVGVPLGRAEILFLRTVARHPDENVSALSARLGITKGAVTQMAARLAPKDLLEVIRREDNQKEKYFGLTPRGRAAVEGYQRFHRESNQQLCDFIAGLDEGEAGAVFRFLDCLRQCVPFSEFTCSCKKSNQKVKEEPENEQTAAACARPACRP